MGLGADRDPALGRGFVPGRGEAPDAVHRGQARTGDEGRSSGSARVVDRPNPRGRGQGQGQSVEIPADVRRGPWGGADHRRAVDHPVAAVVRLRLAAVGRRGGLPREPPVAAGRRGAGAGGRGRAGAEHGPVQGRPSIDPYPCPYRLSRPEPVRALAGKRVVPAEVRVRVTAEPAPGGGSPREEPDPGWGRPERWSGVQARVVVPPPRVLPRGVGALPRWFRWPPAKPKPRPKPRLSSWHGPWVGRRPEGESPHPLGWGTPRWEAQPSWVLAWNENAGYRQGRYGGRAHESTTPDGMERWDILRTGLASATTESLGPHQKPSLAAGQGRSCGWAIPPEHERILPDPPPGLHGPE